MVGGTGVLEGSSVAVGSLGVLVGPTGVFDGGGLEPPPESSEGVGVLVRKKNGELVGVGVGEGVSSPPPRRLVAIGVGVSSAAAVASSTLSVPATAVWTSSGLKPASTTIITLQHMMCQNRKTRG